MPAVISLVSGLAPRVPRGTAVVTILVGHGENKFVVHKDPLCAASKFFNGAFNGKFVEGGSNELRLPEEHPDLIDFLCDWIYMSPDSNPDRPPKQLQDTWAPDSFWLEMFIMADKLLIPGLKILALRQLTAIFNQVVPRIPSTDFINLLCKESGQEIIQQYIAQHIVYWLPKSVKKDDWLGLLKANGSLMAMFGSSIVDIGAEDKALSLFSHPSKSIWIRKQGFDLEELQKEARKADRTETKAPRVLDCAQVNQARKKASYTVLADPTIWSVESDAMVTPASSNKRRRVTQQ